MRLQLIAALAVVRVAGPVAADPQGEATLRIYTDDDDITVVSPSVRGEATIGVTRVEAELTADAVTGASIDVVTSASPRPISERRVELGLGATRPLPRAPALLLSLTLDGSHENDHDAVRAGAGVAAELFDRRLALELRYRAGHDAIGSVVDRAFQRERALHQLTAVAGVVADAATVVDVAVELSSVSGYHASPYRRVPLVEPAWPTPTWLTEELPAVRRSMAGLVRLRRAFGDAWFATLSYRGHADTWSIASQTGTAELRRQLGDRVLAGVTVRGYRQDAARFYRSTYVADGEVPAWRTRDRTLGAMRTLFASVTADVAVGADAPWHATVAAGVLASWFLDFPLQSDRHALVVTVSLTRPFGGVP